ncbi:MAG: hypothetical protein QOG79_3330 [Mycobacterium sp.]|jgi:hypothetical protein|nr:hypothetical protein [Mycobacterium sp.]MDT5300088.1 hypothetical protein [Mycobacterium sp.]MDT5344247.1 hypothetical protein [Mycobacterium sp.]
MSTRHRRPATMWLRRIAVTALVTTTLTIGGAATAMAYAPVNIVHTERVQAGPYGVTVGFSVWPIRAMQSLDFTFMPDGGIADTSGTLIISGPGVQPDERSTPLVRHPRKPDAWGLDVQAFNAPGTYSFEFVINGPQGQGRGTLSDVTILKQPGPPLPLSWTIGLLPLIALVVFITVAWRRTKPGRQPLTV